MPVTGIEDEFQRLAGEMHNDFQHNEQLTDSIFRWGITEHLHFNSVIAQAFTSTVVHIIMQETFIDFVYNFICHLHLAVNYKDHFVCLLFEVFLLPEAFI